MKNTLLITALYVLLAGCDSDRQAQPVATLDPFPADVDPTSSHGRMLLRLRAICEESAQGNPYLSTWNIGTLTSSNSV